MASNPSNNSKAPSGGAADGAAALMRRVTAVLTTTSVPDDIDGNILMHGGGGSLVPATATRSAQVAEAEPQFEFGKDWHDDPQYEDQFERYPDSVRQGPSRTEVLDMSVKEDRAHLDYLQELRDPPNAPRIMILELEKQFSPTKDNWMVWIVYRRYQYRRLVDKKKGNATSLVPDAEPQEGAPTSEVCNAEQVAASTIKHDNSP